MRRWRRAGTEVSVVGVDRRRFRPIQESLGSHSVPVPRCAGLHGCTFGGLHLATSTVFSAGKGLRPIHQLGDRGRTDIRFRAPSVM